MLSSRVCLASVMGHLRIHSWWTLKDYYPCMFNVFRNEQFFFQREGGATFSKRSPAEQTCWKNYRASYKVGELWRKSNKWCLLTRSCVWFFFSVCWSLHSNVLTSKQCELWPLPWFDPLCQWPRFGNPFISRSHTFSPEMPQRYLL